MENKDSVYSSFREKMLEYRFLAELYEYLWLENNFDVEIIRPDVDSSGYDLVISSKAKTVYLQFKTKKQEGKTTGWNVHKKILDKTHAFILLIEYVEPEEGEGLSIAYKYADLKSQNIQFDEVKHTKANAQGEKLVRKDMRKVKQRYFMETKFEEFIEHILS